MRRFLKSFLPVLLSALAAAYAVFRPSTESIRLAWDHSPTAGCEYRVYVEGDGAPPPADVGRVTGYEVTGLRNARRYSFRVTAVLDGMESEPAGPVEAIAGRAQPVRRR